ncbi:hypothetical protein [Pseudomonas citronellolis]|uniref:hypothetical protein n=1 Tax=Pseudomonas citronellolis TaxID=53408 RepID=UPI0023E38AAF|nr:hypothetical protein [Pseudomonas citronellolis]MDF3936653.1 hypothetical protein [Pseudomonas citronellolis]
MKKVLLIGALLFSGMSAAGEQVLLMDQAQRKAGDQVNLADMSYVLYKERPCGLPIVHAKDMRGGTVRYGDGIHKLCWGLTLRSDVVVVDDLGESPQAVPMSVYRAAELRGDGSAVITKAN